MPSPTVLAYVHPLAGLVASALVAYQASLGLGARGGGRRAEEARRRHARLGPWLWTLVAVNWAGGLAAVRWWRTDIEAAASGHFTVGTIILALLTAGALLSRRVPIDARARAVHPLLGAAALLLCGVQIFLGLQLLP
jgi:hypothetical protein